MDGLVRAGSMPAAELVSGPKIHTAAWRTQQAKLADAIEALANDGRSAEEIGKALGIPRARVLRIARQRASIWPERPAGGGSVSSCRRRMLSGSPPWQRWQRSRGPK